MKEKNLSFKVYGIIPDDTVLVKMLKKRSGKKIYDTSYTHFETEGIDYEYLSIKRNIFNVFKERLQREKTFLEYNELIFNQIYNNVKRENFQLIHAHGMYEPPAGLIAKHFSEKLKIPYIITCHGSDVNYKMPLTPQLYIDTFEQAAKVLFVSNAILNKAKSYGYSGKNAVIIPNGVNIDLFKMLDKEKIKQELHFIRKVVGFVGNLLPVKRADKLPEIFEEINQNFETDFLIIGEGRLKNKIEKNCRKKNLNITFTGKLPHEKISYYLNAMDVLILPSRNEGFPCVVLEAQACGVPVVGSNNGGIPEAIGEGGIVVNEGENFEKRFAEGVIKILKNPIDKNFLRNRATEYSWNNITKMEFDIYQNLF
ncbi:MAG TPA: glycosyltransferase [Paludibacteraceae bacterium]|nr:glycosyltransferase [Paludibacteraceae bacterium]